VEEGGRTHFNQSAKVAHDPSVRSTPEQDYYAAFGAKSGAQSAAEGYETDSRAGDAPTFANFGRMWATENC
jgi:hypothetical protein